MGLFDTTKSSTNNQNNTENVNAPINIQDSDGAVIANRDLTQINNSTNYSISTDYNAIDDASRLAQGSIDAAASLAGGAQDLAARVAGIVADSSRQIGDVLLESDRTNKALALNSEDNILTAAGLALDYSAGARADVLSIARSSNANVLDAAAGAVSLARTSQQQSGDLAADFLNKAISFAGSVQNKFSDTISSTVDALQRIGIQQNTSADQRVADTATTVTKYALAAVAVVVVGVGIIAYARR